MFHHHEFPWLAVPLLTIGLAQAQPAFEAASVKPSTTNVLVSRGGPGTASPGQITYTYQTMRMLVTKAWDLKVYQISGPESLDGPRFDIAAKLPPDATARDFQLMLQRLLTDRIGLVVHHELKEMTVYEMVVAKGGLKMKAAEPAPEAGAPDTPGRFATDKDGFAILPPGKKAAIISGLGGVFRISARMMGPTDLLRTMEQYSGRPVIDKAGLSGNYDFTLAFSRESVPQPPGLRTAREAMGLPPLPTSGDVKAPTAEAVEPAPTFLEAIVRQLGLKLESAKGQIDVVVVDRFNKEPIEN